MYHYRFAKLLLVGLLFVLTACQPVTRQRAQPAIIEQKTPTTALVAQTPPAEPQVVATIKTGTGGMGMAAGAGAIWVTARDDQAIKRIDPQTNGVVAAIKVGAETNAIAFGAGSLWAAGESDHAVYRIDPATNTLVATIALDKVPFSFAFGAGSVWVGTAGPIGGPKGGSVMRIDPATNQIVATIQLDVADAEAGGLAFSQGLLWVGIWRGHRVRQIDPQTNQIVGESIEVGGNPHMSTANDDAVWFGLEKAQNQLARIDPKTKQVVATIKLPGSRDPFGIVIDQQRVWVVNTDGALAWVDPATNQATTALKLPSQTVGIAITAGAIWVGNETAGVVYRIQP